MSTIDERLQWIIDNLRQPDGLPWNQKALARAMGLKSPAHVGQVVRGDVEDPRGSFLEALVRATGVNGHWLLTGDGAPIEGPHAPPVDLSDRPLWQNLPNWRELVGAGARTAGAPVGVGTDRGERSPVVCDADACDVGGTRALRAAPRTASRSAASAVWEGEEEGVGAAMGRGSAVARAALVEAQGDGRLEGDLVEAFADHMRELADGEGVEGIVRGQALTLIITPELPAGLEGLLSPSGVLYVRRSCDRSHELVVALHELAHHALAEHEHTHADVWRVALAMGAPRSLVRRCRGDAVELAATTGLPVWACELRINAVKHGLG